MKNNTVDFNKNSKILFYFKNDNFTHLSVNAQIIYIFNH